MQDLRLTREGYIPVTGGRVWYGIAGAERKGVPLLALHGGPGVPHDYLEPLEALSDERPVIFYDQLGCGASDRPDDLSLWTVARFVEELGQVRAALALEKVHLLGQSWGSMLAVDYMLTSHTPAVASLILSGPCMSASRWHRDQRAYLDELPEDMRRVILASEESGDFHSDDYQDAVTYYYRMHVCRMNPWPDCLNRALEKMSYTVYAHMWGPSEFTIVGTLRSYERAERLKEITVPALFTCGRYDEATPEATESYHRMLPGSEIVVFEDASHDHHIEQAERYLKTVRDFLSRVESK